MLEAIFDVIRILLDVLWWIIIIQIIISWLFVFNVLNAGSEGVRRFALALEKITAPLYRPIRRLLPDFGGIDFSPMVILILIMVIQRLLIGVEAELVYNG